MSYLEMQSVDTTGVGKPPDVHFELRGDHRMLEAEPDGARIVVRRVDATRTWVQLWDNKLVGPDGAAQLTVDMVLDHRAAEDSVHEQWRDCASYACEIACALYWSQWRSQQVRQAKAALSDALVGLSKGSA